MTTYIQDIEDSQGDLSDIAHFDSRACWQDFLIGGGYDETKGGLFPCPESLDYPVYCATCGGLVDVGLTSEGAEYVLDHLTSWEPAKIAELIETNYLRDRAIARRYQDIRAETPTYPAQWAYRYAVEFVDGLSTALDPDGWEEVSDTLRMQLERGGFSIMVEAWQDIDPIQMGKFSDRWEKGAIQDPAWHSDSDMYRWYHPMMSLEEHRHELAKIGYSRHEAYTLARSYVLRDLVQDANREAYGLTVTASRDGVELGSASIGGFDVPTDARANDIQRMLAQAVSDYGLVDEAVSQAKSALAKLTAA